jgi:hypothetical protein
LVGDLAGPADLARHGAGGGIAPDPQHTPPAAMQEGVADQLVDRRHEIGDARLRQSPVGHLVADLPADSREVVHGAEAAADAVGRRRGQRLITERGQPGTGVALVGVPLAGPHDHRVRALEVGQGRAVDGAGVVQALDRHRHAVEGQVEQGLVPGDLRDLAGRAPRPHQLAGHPEPTTGVAIDELPVGGDQSRRVGADGAHVDERHRVA